MAVIKTRHIREAWLYAIPAEPAAEAWTTWVRQFGLDPREVVVDNDQPTITVDDFARTVTVSVFLLNAEGKRYFDAVNRERGAQRRIVIHVDDEIAPFPTT